MTLLKWLPILWANTKHGCFVRNKYGIGRWHCFDWNEI